jgi:hypothetical protein
MAADVGVKPVGFHDHGHGIPAHVAFDAPLNFPIAWVARLFFSGNGIDIGSVYGVRDFEAGFPQPRKQLFEHESCVLRLLVLENSLEKILQRSEPLIPVASGSIGAFSRAIDGDCTGSRLFVRFH